MNCIRHPLMVAVTQESWCICWAEDGKRRMELRSLTDSYMRRLTAAVLQTLKPCTWSCKLSPRLIQSRYMEKQVDGLGFACR